MTKRILTPEQILMKEERDNLIKKLSAVKFPDGCSTIECNKIGITLGKTGPTIMNYILGNVNDGILGNAILRELKKLKYVK